MDLDFTANSASPVYRPLAKNGPLRPTAGFIGDGVARVGQFVSGNGCHAVRCVGRTRLPCQKETTQ